METLIQETVEEILTKLDSPFRKVRIEELKDENSIRVNIESEEPSLLIGHHGENIYALQSILKTILFRKGIETNVILDVDDYRKRQENNVIELAERKIETLRKSGSSQSLPAMSGYFRRIVHLHIAKQHEDIATESIGEGDMRYLTIKLK